MCRLGLWGLQVKKAVQVSRCPQAYRSQITSQWDRVPPQSASSDAPGGLEPMSKGLFLEAGC